MIGREQGSDMNEILIGCYVSSITTAETLKSFKDQLSFGLAISSSHVFQELTQSGLILPKLSCLLLSCFPAFPHDNLKVFVEKNVNKVVGTAALWPGWVCGL